ncbi:MAG: ThuA domain-containing protein [Pirellulales bacterium]
MTPGRRKVKIMRFAGIALWRALVLAATVAWAAVAVSAAELLPGAAMMSISAADRAKIEQALPAKAIVPPERPRKLLIFDRNVNYGGHPSARHANVAFTLLGRRTGAFETVVSQDPAVFERQSLRQFDAVFFNNTVGNLFEDAQLRRNLVEFVYAGGGLLGVHGTSVAFTRWPGASEDWPEFGIMLGARGANHRNSDEHVFIKLDDPEHPLNQAFGGREFDYRDEFFRVHEPYSRSRVRVLLTIDVDKLDTQGGAARGQIERADRDFAVAWVRGYGRGRVFYSTIAHNSYVFWDPLMLKFYLGAIQFALGDLPAPALPSARLTPALRAQEKLQWRLGAEARAFPKETLFEAIDQTAKLGLPYLGAASSQTVSREVPKQLDDRLNGDELPAIRLKLDAAGVRLLTYSLPRLPGDEPGCRKVFEFGRLLGVEALAVQAAPASLDVVEKLCEEYRIALAIDDGGRLDDVLKACEKRSPRIGVCGVVASWLLGGIDPVEAARKLKGRLIVVRLPGKNAAADGPRIEQFLEELRRLDVRPVMFAPDSAGEGTDAARGMAQGIESFNKITLKLAK